jgi:hypothetical protein
VPTPVPGPPGRRRVLRAGVVAVLGAAGAGALAGCSDEASSPGDVLRDLGIGGEPSPPPPSERELRRRRTAEGARLALDALAGAGAAGTTSLAARFGGAGPGIGDARAAHAAHLALLEPAGSSAGPSGTPADPSPGPSAAPSQGPVRPSPPTTPEAAAGVLDVLADEAVTDAVAERAEPEPDLDLAVLVARVAACRDAQAAGLDVATEGGAVWPNAEVAEEARAPLVAALQHLLAQQHRARWSYAVVEAWATDRADDARAAREAATRAVEALLGVVDLLGEVPVAAEGTYPTDDAGSPVDGPAAAAALALRLEDALALAAGTVLVAAVAAGSREWVAAAVRDVARTERARWSWGGEPAALPGV